MIIYPFPLFKKIKSKFNQVQQKKRNKKFKYHKPDFKIYTISILIK